MNGPKVGSNCLSKIWLYAGKPENPALLPIGSDNATGADNQQERLLREQNPQRPYARQFKRTEDMVPSAWRHAGRSWNNLRSGTTSGSRI
jgi:hypothetical protein